MPKVSRGTPYSRLLVYQWKDVQVLPVEANKPEALVFELVPGQPGIDVTQRQVRREDEPGL